MHVDKKGFHALIRELNVLIRFLSETVRQVCLQKPRHLF